MLVASHGRARLCPDQPEPGFRRHRGRLNIVPLRPNRRVMGGPGPIRPIRRPPRRRSRPSCAGAPTMSGWPSRSPWSPRTWPTRWPLPGVPSAAPPAMTWLAGRWPPLLPRCSRSRR